MAKIALPKRRSRGESFSNFGRLLVSDRSASRLGNMDGDVVNFYRSITLNFKNQMVGLLRECASVKRKLLPLLIGRWQPASEACSAQGVFNPNPQRF